MKAENFFTANADLRFTFERVVPWEEVVPAAEHGRRDGAGLATSAEAIELYREALTLVGQYAGSEIAARAGEVDRAGAAHHDGRTGLVAPLQANLDGLRELGVCGLSIPREYGGENFPFTVSSMALEILARACPTTMVQYAFFLSPAMMLLRFASEELKRRLLPRLATGQISGSVAMTEPQAGSDVGRIATTATPIDDGWRLTGRKQFITNGLGEICIVLARSEENSSGLTGLSLFLVERRRLHDGGPVDNYVVERAEDKICLTASPTCGLAFDRSHAVLLGRRGEGWREILTFMNESRVAVGLQGVGTAQAALAEARAYAEERVQMGRPIARHPMIADMLLDMEASVAALRAVCYRATVLHDLTEGARIEAKQLPEGDPRRTALEAAGAARVGALRELTPLVKWLGAEEVIRVCRMAMQIHGGYGVIKEYEIERIMRDSLILPIYEGTSQIQALMATKDLLRAALARPSILAGGTLSPTLAAARYPGELGRLYRQARSALNASVRALLYDLLRQGGREGLMGLLRGGSAIPEGDTAYALLHAERITAMLAHLHAARLLADQSRRYPERLPPALRAMRRADAVCAAGARQIRRGDRSALVDSWAAAPAES